MQLYPIFVYSENSPFLSPLNIVSQYLETQSSNPHVVTLLWLAEL